MGHKDYEQAAAELAHSIGHLIRRMRVAAATHELSWTESAVMARLFREGALTTAELARAESVKPQSMGATVAGLEERGIVERKPHPTDGRQLLIALTAKGRAIRTSTRDAKRSWLAQALAELPAADRETVLKAGSILQRLAERQGEH